MLRELKNNESRGFTLIELIVVIAILGILMTLAVPRLLGYTEMAKETADGQLAAIYKNTFDILIGSGKIESDPEGPVVITVDKTGTISYADDNELTSVDAFVDGTTPTGEELLVKIQNDYVSKTSSNEAQVFKSRKYTSDGADGIKITIDTAGVVTVDINSQD